MLYHLSVKVSTKIIEMYLWETQYVLQLFIKVIGIKYMADAMTVYHYSAEHTIHLRGTLTDASAFPRLGWGWWSGTGCAAASSAVPPLGEVIRAASCPCYYQVPAHSITGGRFWVSSPLNLYCATPAERKRFNVRLLASPLMWPYPRWKSQHLLH